MTYILRDLDRCHILCFGIKQKPLSPEVSHLIYQFFVIVMYHTTSYTMLVTRTNGYGCFVGFTTTQEFSFDFGADFDAC